MTSGPQIRVSPDKASLARAAAEALAGWARAAVAERGRFCLALSGGSTPWAMLDALTGMDVPWGGVHVFQVDEREAPNGHEDRNWTRIVRRLLARVPIRPENAYPMLVNTSDRRGECLRYDAALREVCGGVLDVVQLGLGNDGHTASLVPGDPELDRMQDGSLTTWTSSEYQGRYRMTMTWRALDAARTRMWLVAGAGKAEMLPRAVSGDVTIPAGRVSRAPETVFFVDEAAAAQLAGGPAAGA